jgi:hypothetical protein
MEVMAACSRGRVAGERGQRIGRSGSGPPRRPDGFCFFDRYHDAITKEQKYAAFIGGPEYGASLLMFTDDALRKGAPFLSDSLLHEMVHYAQKYLDKDLTAERHGGCC